MPLDFDLVYASYKLASTNGVTLSLKCSIVLLCSDLTGDRYLRETLSPSSFFCSISHAYNCSWSRVFVLLCRNPREAGSPISGS